MNAYEWIGRIVVLLWASLLLGGAAAWLVHRVPAWWAERQYRRAMAYLDGQVRARGIAPQANPRDEDGERDLVPEGGFCGTWPGIAAIDAVKRAHPRLSDIQAYAVAVARTRPQRERA